MNFLSSLRVQWARFSIINKIRAQQNAKNPTLKTKPSLPHQIDDCIGTVASYEQKKMNLSPFQLYLIETTSMERPYTGNLWAEESPGFYHCSICDTRLFTFDQKIKTKSGFASFYDYVEQRVTVLEEKVKIETVNLFMDELLEEDMSRNKRCECAQCKSHIGAVFFDGPHPTFLRYSINSAALKFVTLADFVNPNIKKRQQKKKREKDRVRYLR